MGQGRGLWESSWSSPGGQATTLWQTQPRMLQLSGGPDLARVQVGRQGFVSLCPHPGAQREEGCQVSAGLPASQVPSQAPRFIFQSSPPTASSFPLQSLTSQAPRPAPAQASWQPAKLGQGSQAHLIDEKLRLGERRRHDLPQGLSLGSLLVSGCISQSRPSTLLPRILCRTSGSPLTSLLTNVSTSPPSGVLREHSIPQPITCSFINSSFNSPN